MQRLREQYPSFVREYRGFVHGYSHVQLDEDISAVLAEFKWGRFMLAEIMHDDASR
jgi:hypothetical protein